MKPKKKLTNLEVEIEKFIMRVGDIYAPVLLIIDRVIDKTSINYKSFH